MDHRDIWTTLDDPDDWTTALCVGERVDHPETVPTADRRGEARQSEESGEIDRLKTELADLRSIVAYAAGQLKRLSSRYTVVRGPDGQMTNAERLYELLLRDAHQIGRDLSQLLPVTQPRHPFPPHS